MDAHEFHVCRFRRSLVGWRAVRKLDGCRAAFSRIERRFGRLAVQITGGVDGLEITVDGQHRLHDVIALRQLRQLSRMGTYRPPN